MIASLLCCNGRFSSDYNDYDSTDKGESADEKTAIRNGQGNLGGLEERAGHSNNPSRAGTATASARPGQYSSPSQDTKAAGISGLFDSIRSGLGGGGADDEADSGAVGGGARPPGCSVVVQHVSCRRRRDSGSSADSDSDSQAKSKGRGGGGGGVNKKAYSESNGMASQPLAAGGGRGAGGRTKGRAEAEESLAHSLGHDSGEHDARFSTLSHSQSSDASASTVKERGMGRRGNGNEDGKVPVAKPRPNHQARKSDLPVKREGRSQRREGVVTGPVPSRHNASDTEQRPSSSCSFTSSEWGEVTPSAVDSLPSLLDQPSPLDRKDEVGSAVGTSSGYASASRRSIPDIGDGSTNHSSPQHNNNHNHHQQNHKGSPSPAKSKSPASKLPVLMAFRRDSKSSLNQEPASSSQAEPHHQSHQPAHQAPHHQSRNNNNTATAHTAAQNLVRRQSSGRSETLSLSSAKTASPITKMRLLDLASNRALERDGSDSVQSWSGGSDDTMSLGMSCSGVPTDAPVFQKVHYSKQQRKGSHDAPEPQHISSNLNKSRQSDGDFTGASDQSDGGGASPMRPSSKASGGGGGTPKRSSNSHLSTPSVVATSHTGSIGEKSVDDDDNIDELFAKHLPGSRLGISRNSIGSSRESLASVYSDAGEINYGRIPVTGDITFSLVYDVKCSALRVHIKGCHDLAPVDTKHNRSDPYVKVYLLPDKTRSGKRKTKIKKHTLNPVFDETLSYHISQGELENRTLWVTVWHSDRFGRNDFLGEVTIPMDVHRFDDTAFCTYDLESRMPEEMNETAMQYKGELVVSLMYVTPDKVEDGKKSKSKSKKSKAAVDPRGEVHAMIKAANNLTAVRSNGGSDPFVKGYLLPDQRRTGKQKTPVVKNSVNPMWNQILVFDGIDPMELADRSLELTVWDHEKLGTNEFLGGVRLNLGQGVVKGGHQVDWMDARGEEAITWQSMMERPNTWIDAKLPLRASMGKSSTKK
ncbi:synaptotagmin-like protein 5 isoform X4 [Littorina saxatilis]|uniref:synaptotagmin-like protein 5 isoform X4 n=1 Tax=Littorina saxatilis TaxID=31220 RepID=UPI0038B44E3E